MIKTNEKNNYNGFTHFILQLPDNVILSMYFSNKLKKNQYITLLL